MMTKQNFRTRNNACRSLVVVAAAAMAVLTAGCASLASGNTPEKIVEKRSEAYWKARFAGDAAKAYGYVTPGYRALHDERAYALAYGAVPNLRDPEVLSIKCEGAQDESQKEVQRCVLRKQFTASIPMTAKGTAPIAMDEIWLKEDGNWWLFLSE